MATYHQKTAQVRGALRALRKVYRRADTTGELLERELDRLIGRKTLIEPPSLRKTIALIQVYQAAAQALGPAINDAVNVATS